MPLFQASYYSHCLHMNCNANVIIPQKGQEMLSCDPHFDQDGKIPIIWLLHECGGDHTSWQRYTHVERYAAARGIAVVMPGVLNQSFYSDMVEGGAYFEYITQELPELVHQFFPQLSLNFESNFIAGASMGGYGALKVALTFPERFAAVGCFSSGNLIEMRLPRRETCNEYLRPLLGVPRNVLNTDTMADAIGTSNDLCYLLENAVGKNKAIPKIIMYCGTEDFLLGLSDSFAQKVRKLAPHASLTYENSPGLHNWEFWDGALVRFMDACGFTSAL